jgi:hypothetical protein
MFEDREFLEECFDLLREDEDEDEGDSYLPPVKMMKLDKMALWVTVLNHGQTPSGQRGPLCAPAYLGVARCRRPTAR